MSGLKGKIIIVTGGHGQLGSAFMKHLNSLGAIPVSWDVNAPNPIDVTQVEDISHARETIAKEYGKPIHGLINCAAIDTPPGRKPGAWERTIRVNLTAIRNCVDMVSPRMTEGGSIINIGSIYGEVSPDPRIYPDGFDKPLAYSTTKAALTGLTKWYAVRLAQQKIRVNLMVLGGVFNRQPKAFVKAYECKVPLGRMAHPSDYVGGVEFLLGEASRYITGSTITLDGGYTAW